MPTDLVATMPPGIVPALSIRQEFFELMRRIDRATPERPRLGERPDHDRHRIDIRQPADFGFASRELSGLRQPRGGSTTIEIGLRHFGPFAPYGPLPIDITEYARDASLAQRQQAFEAFVNLPVARLAVLYYRAWAQLKECVCYDRGENAFLGRLSAVVAALPYSSRRIHVRSLRQAFCGAYLHGTASLRQLEKMLAHYFSVGISIASRTPGWIASDPALRRARGDARIGELRLGKRFYDAQHRIAITVGPLAAPDYLAWQGAADRLAQMEHIVRDFVGHRVVGRVVLAIRTEPGMGMRLSGARVGRNTWLKPGTRIHRQALRPCAAATALQGDN